MSRNAIQDHEAGDGSLSEEDVKALCQGLRDMLANLSARDEYWERINEEEAELQDNPPSLLDEMVSLQSTPWGVEPRISLEDWTDGMACVWANVGRYLRIAMDRTSVKESKHIHNDGLRDSSQNKVTERAEDLPEEHESSNVNSPQELAVLMRTVISRTCLEEYS